jgi:hypothetical protein
MYYWKRSAQLFQVFGYSLFNDAVSNSDYIALNGWTINAGVHKFRVSGRMGD